MTEDLHQKRMIRSEGMKAIEGALKYSQQHGASAIDILFLCQLHDEAARQGIQNEK